MRLNAHAPILPSYSVLNIKPKALLGPVSQSTSTVKSKTKSLALRNKQSQSKSNNFLLTQLLTANKLGLERLLKLLSEE